MSGAAFPVGLCALQVMHHTIFQPAERVRLTADLAAHGMSLPPVRGQDGGPASRMHTSPEAGPRRQPPGLALRASSGAAASVADGTRGLPRPRPWHALENGLRACSPW